MSAVPPEVEALIADEPHVAHLGTSVDDAPHVAPLWYRYVDGIIEIATTGRSLNNIRENRRVALSIQSSKDGMPEWMVSIRGTATIIEEEDASARGTARIHRKYGIAEDAFPENVLVRIDVGSVFHQIY